MHASPVAVNVCMTSYIILTCFMMSISDWFAAFACRLVAFGQILKLDYGSDMVMYSTPYIFVAYSANL